MDVDIGTFNAQANNSTLNAAFEFFNKVSTEGTFDPTNELHAFVLSYITSFYTDFLGSMRSIESELEKVLLIQIIITLTATQFIIN
jgi:DNA-binding SARP family transcriptional activator